MLNDITKEVIHDKADHIMEYTNYMYEQLTEEDGFTAEQALQIICSFIQGHSSR